MEEFWSERDEEQLRRLQERKQRVQVARRGILDELVDGVMLPGTFRNEVLAWIEDNSEHIVQEIRRWQEYGK